MEELTSQEVKRIGVDRGYRGKAHHPEGKETLIVGRKRDEEIFKEEVLDRASDRTYETGAQGWDYLGGIEGDKFNPILSAICV